MDWPQQQQQQQKYIIIIIERGLSLPRGVLLGLLVSKGIYSPRCCCHRSGGCLHSKSMSCGDFGCNKTTTNPANREGWKVKVCGGGGLKSFRISLLNGRNDDARWHQNGLRFPFFPKSMARLSIHLVKSLPFLDHVYSRHAKRLERKKECHV